MLQQQTEDWHDQSENNPPREQPVPENFQEESHPVKHQQRPKQVAKRTATGPVRKLTPEEQRLRDIEHYEKDISYSPRYYDEEFEYRHVSLPRALARYLPQDRLMSEPEWRELGVKQSYGWEHYMVHAPEPHILLFKREKDYQEKVRSHAHFVDYLSQR
ncbi:regulatory subunit of cyclin-dependent kinase [Endogone sp. FLAS-F59071]|nr:regulatory subunit of cyclin-dependent kinase [Endogone sp. FLAS-F59071]|eukprot:RUS17346.1 regulatory subunit of cyclin-dependent kinase [Endogone sp. FLAS-F59071]